MEYKNKKLEEFERKLKTEKVAIIGLGVSNSPLIDYLHDKQADVTVFDDRETEKLDENIFKKVKEYDKMYVVRPQYFINFLSLITSLSFRFKELILDNMKEQEKFKDSLEIKQEFEKFKKDLMDKPLEKLEKELNAIIKNANDIKASSDKIITSASDLINKTLENMKSKIENFKIDKLCKKIDKLDLE